MTVLIGCDGISPTTPSADEFPFAEFPSSQAGPTGEGEAGEAGTGGAQASGSHPHQPAGFTLISETSFASPSEVGWSSAAELRIVEDATAPRSPGSVGRIVFPGGWDGGYSPAWAETRITDLGYKRLYLSFWVKLSDNWQGHGTGVNKVAIAWTNEHPVVVANVNGRGSGRLESEIRIQDVPDGAQNLAANLSDMEIERGRWHRWEILLVSNSGSASNGEIHWWIDDQKAGEYTDVRFTRSGQSKIWNNASWRPIWGGQGDRVQRSMSMSMDHFYVSGAR